MLDGDLILAASATALWQMPDRLPINGSESSILAHHRPARRGGPFHERTLWRYAAIGARSAVTIPVTTLKNVRWSILILREKAVWLGDVEATSEAEAIANGTEEFKQDLID
jgi:hypothetical protein